MDYLDGSNKKRKYNDDEFVEKKDKMVIGNDLTYSFGAEVHFSENVTKDSIERVIKLMTKIVYDHEKKYKGEKKKLVITYIVDSPGGSVHAILKFVDFINLVKLKHPHISFVSIATGMVASAGTIMCVVADKRMATTYSQMMIHELSSGNSGKYTQLMTYSKHLTTLHNILLDIYMKVSKVDRDVLEKLLGEETWCNAEDYLKLGLIDSIASV